MNALFITLDSAPANQPQGGGYTMIIMMVVIFAIMYFFMIRPQRKKQKQIEEARRAIGVGQNVVTIGGIYGQVKDTDDLNNALIIEVSKGVNIKVDRNSVNPVTPVA